VVLICRAVTNRQDVGQRCVISTSIAETTLTIPGVSYIIDSGLTKASYFDPRLGLEMLVTQPVVRVRATKMSFSCKYNLQRLP
jgi:HrpA-like RNA helicase